jgi:hypothetical protein
MTTTATLAEPMSKIARRTLLALSAGNFVVGIAAFVVLGLMSTITRDLAIDPAEGARLMTFYAVAYAIGSPLLIAGTGTLPRRLVITGSMLLVGLGSIACALSPTLAGMEAARVMTALGAGLYSPATSAVAVSLVPPERRGWALSQVFIGFTGHRQSDWRMARLFVGLAFCILCSWCTVTYHDSGCLARGAGGNSIPAHVADRIEPCPENAAHAGGIAVHSLFCGGDLHDPHLLDVNSRDTAWVWRCGHRHCTGDLWLHGICSGSAVGAND